MKNSILVAIANIIGFYFIRITSVLISFLFGIGASDSSSKYFLILDIVDLLLQTSIMLIIVLNKKWGLNYWHLVISLIVIASLGFLSFKEIIP